MHEVGIHACRHPGPNAIAAMLRGIRGAIGHVDGGRE
jgi:hypothetical protein